MIFQDGSGQGGPTMTNKKAEVIVITNQKGGVAKTTTALALFEILHLKKKKVLFVDLDSQGNASSALNADPAYGTSLDFITDHTNDAIQATRFGDLLRADASLALFDDEKGRNKSPSILLARALDRVNDEYDYVIVDTPPSLGLATINALTAATKIVLVAIPDTDSITGVTSTISAISSVKNSEVEIAGLLITKFRTNPVRNVEKALVSAASNMMEVVGSKTFKQPIRDCSALTEARTLRKGIIEYAPLSNAASDYIAFVEELTERK
jgi:chromosome partitioning protein